MIGSRAWRALMRRNFIYRRRNIVGTFMEIFLPCLFIGALVAIKQSLQNTDGFSSETVKPTFPDDMETYIPMSFTDYVTAMQADRFCTPHDFFGDFTVTGMQTYNWQVPFVKCDTRECVKDGQDATPFCEYPQFGLAASSAADTIGLDRREKFANYVLERYPQLQTLYSPDNPDRPYEFFHFFDSSKAMENYVQDRNYGTNGFPKIALGVVFSGDPANPNHYLYTLRVNATNFNLPANEARPATLTTPDTGIKFQSFAKTDGDSCIPIGGTPDQGPLQDSCTGQYLYNGALVIQRLIDDWIMVDSNAKAADYFVAEHGVRFVSFPTREFVQNGFYSAIADVLPLFVLLGLLYPVSAMIRALTLEKEGRQKELMKIMSVTESDIGWSWFMSFFGFHFLTTLACTGLSRALYDNTDGVFLFLLWFFGWLAIINFSFLMASLFTRTTRAILVGLLVYFIGYILTVTISFEEGSSGVIGLVSLHPVAALSYGLQEIGRLEDLSIGVTGSTWDNSESKSGFTFSNALYSLIIDSILWSILTWYLNRIVRSDTGQPLPFYFPFTASYWCPGRVRHDWSNGIEDPEYDSAVPVEPVSDALRSQQRDGRGVEIRNLQKQFGDKIAVDGLSLSMYTGQITALLGHNGAGKTTTISMLTGMLKPTDGYAVVAGKDIRSELPGIRQEIGICLQHDCLFPQLTVREHVQFFARVKGQYARLSHAEAEEKVDTSIRDVALMEKRDTFSKNLSGGMKRKLSVAIAFCGDSKTVLLDEPTSGMDPFSRRFTWNVIRQYRQDRCIILTTHFMDEADILGDRIAIMAEGQLRCAGSSLFLKKEYGVGYHLTIEKRSATIGSSSHGRPVHAEEAGNGGEIEIKAGGGSSPGNLDAQLIEIVKGSVRQANILSNVGSELSFQLPLTAASNFIGMFDQLDQQVDQGAIVSYGMGVTTLDEVFLLVARGETNRRSSMASSQFLREDMLKAAQATEDKSYRSRMDLEKEGLMTRHLGALFQKRALNFKRDKKAWVCTTLLPSLFVLFGFLLFKFVPTDRSRGSLALDLNDYNDKVDVEPRNPIPFNNPDSLFTCQPGRCAYQEEFVNTPTGESYFFCGAQSSVRGDCSILTSDQVVGSITQAGAVAQGSGVANMSEISHALFNTSNAYKATRYGGIYFSHEFGSTVDGTGYNDTVVNKCLSNLQNQSGGTRGTNGYIRESECMNYGGIGYVISYNFTALHVAPLYQALADEAIIRQAVDDTYAIKATIHPLPITSIEKGFGDAEDAFVAWLLVVLSFPLIPGAFAAFVVAERESKAKHLQTVAGVQPSAYWISTYFWDIMNYQFPVWITVILMFAFDITVLTTTNRGVVGGILVLILLFGPATAGFAYCISFAFKSPSMCYLFFIIFGFLIGLGGPLAAFILRLIGEDPGNPQDNLVLGADIIEWILRFTPTFCLGKGLFNAINVETFEFLAGEPITVWHDSVLMLEVVFLAWQSVVFIAIAIQIDIWSSNPRAVSIWNSFIGFLCCRCGTGASRAHAHDANFALPDDSDVVEEQQRVLAGEANDDLIVVSQMTKVYDNGKVAVNNISFGIPPGQCFGLLGINGAGKTTTMGILTAEFPPTTGDATLAGYSVRNEPEKTRRRIGYCPQFDAHFTNMSGREHVELYASIKGVPRQFVKEAAAAKLAEVGLSEEDSDRLAAGYSGGMKRRLSLAIATIGQPQIVFLDECSTGVDPVARREIWQLVSDMVTGGDVPPEERTSVILTTHSMEECEALCPRIAIMANGKLRCLGSAQHLKNKFGQGFQVELKVKVVDTEDEDYVANLTQLARSGGGVSEEAALSSAEEVFFKYDQAIAALRALTGNTYLTEMITETDPNGYVIYKDAVSPIGVSLDELASFATLELRMFNLSKYIEDNFPASILRERQDVKTRYEVSSENVRISSIFASIEKNKDTLMLSDYGVSQTSLEQVFNMHAAEAERLKAGTRDG